MEETLRPRIRAIVGLGNPGRKYDGAPHNLGFEVVDLLKGESEFRPGPGDYYQCRTILASREIVLLKPTTYMNRSGIAVQQFAESDGVLPLEMLVVADDFNLPLGRIRLRQTGTDGGHNGLASIIYHLQTDDFPRIRIGIGPAPENIPAEEFVLERFKQEQIPIVKEIITRAANAAIAWVNEGFDNAAGMYNRAAE